MQSPARQDQAPSIEKRAGGAAAHARSVWIWITAGIALRLALSSISIGTNDATTFYRFTTEIREVGLFKTYSSDPDFNHPPLPALWAMLCRAMSGENLHRFTFLFKLAPIAADGASIYLLWRIGAGAFALLAPARGVERGEGDYSLLQTNSIELQDAETQRRNEWRRLEAEQYSSTNRLLLFLFSASRRLGVQKSFQANGNGARLFCRNSRKESSPQPSPGVPVE